MNSIDGGLEAYSRNGNFIFADVYLGLGWRFLSYISVGLWSKHIHVFCYLSKSTKLHKGNFSSNPPPPAFALPEAIFTREAFRGLSLISKWVICQTKRFDTFVWFGSLLLCTFESVQNHRAHITKGAWLGLYHNVLPSVRSR